VAKIRFCKVACQLLRLSVVSNATKVERTGDTAAALRAFASLLVDDATTDWTLTAPDADGQATLTVGTVQTTGPVWALLTEVR
jgi:hypothetical protein